jgi:hypothetical protein
VVCGQILPGSVGRKHAACAENSAGLLHLEVGGGNGIREEDISELVNKCQGLQSIVVQHDDVIDLGFAESMSLRLEGCSQGGMAAPGMRSAHGAEGSQRRWVSEAWRSSKHPGPRLGHQAEQDANSQRRVPWEERQAGGWNAPQDRGMGQMPEDAVELAMSMVTSLANSVERPAKGQQTI